MMPFLFCLLPYTLGKRKCCLIVIKCINPF